MRRPTPRGPLGRSLDEAMQRPPGTAAHLVEDAEAAVRAAARDGRDLVDDGDVQAALTAMYELHYRGLDGVDDRWEWDPDLLAARAVLEDAFEAELRALAAPSPGPAPQSEAGDLAATLFALVAADDGPSVSRFLERKGSLEHWREFLLHRSIYQLKEADPHAWGIPRLTGRAKAALVEIEADEFGGGIPERMHSTMFAQTLQEVGIDATYGAFVDDVPPVTLAHANAMSLLGLHRRLRGALVGHLAAFEMTSSVPNRRYGNGLRRLGFGPAATAYFDEHVEADAVHEQIAAHDLAAALVAAEPELAPDVVLGVRIALALDARLGRHLLQAWTAGTSSLPAPLGAGAAA